MSLLESVSLTTLVLKQAFSFVPFFKCENVETCVKVVILLCF